MASLALPYFENTSAGNVMAVSTMALHSSIVPLTLPHKLGELGEQTQGPLLQLLRRVPAAHQGRALCPTPVALFNLSDSPGR